MMQLPNEAIKELKQIYKTEFNVEMSEDKAKAEARRLLLFFYEFLKLEAEQHAKPQHPTAKRGSAIMPSSDRQNEAGKTEVSQLRMFP